MRSRAKRPDFAACAAPDCSQERRVRMARQALANVDGKSMIGRAGRRVRSAPGHRVSSKPTALPRGERCRDCAIRCVARRLQAATMTGPLAERLVSAGGPPVAVLNEGISGATVWSDRMGEAYLAHVAPMAAGRRHVVDKRPSNFLLCGMIRLILPEARIIHSQRDPVDTCLSCYIGEQAFAYDQTELGRFSIAATGHTGKNYRSGGRSEPLR